MFVVHSHKFHELFQSLEKGSVKNDDAYWRRGETDFVIVHRTFGVIFLQVKAAANKTARAYEKAKEQLEKDQNSLTCVLKRLSVSEYDRKEEKKMEQLGLSEPKRKKEDKKKQRILEELGGKVEEEMNKYPGFVVMPNWSRDKAEERRGCFREDLESVEHFENWWKNNMHRAEEFSQDMYELMAIWFVGPRVLKESCLLGHVIDRNHSKLIKLTMDQLRIMTGDVPKQNIAGPAGSGKTWLLLEKAKQVAEKKQKYEEFTLELTEGKDD
ncbi:Hypp32 [Branchiostoma lanceolatum]|uniref:Hypp32 protein n=1 Tax=Branchiostoma lanceolatum TaxID=7740 RepID=A0A8J9W154_BRALA|nr:Hypp32 [Branchiostoma lanceolatum]